jgi:hypothetical protein
METLSDILKQDMAFPRFLALVTLHHITAAMKQRSCLSIVTEIIEIDPV